MPYTKLVQKAMREGRTKLLIIKALIIGPPGVGKTCIRHLLLDLPPPPRRTSTPLATRATRAISFYRIKADGSGDVTWTELDDDTYIEYIAEEMKMIEHNSSRAVSLQPATSTTSAATGSSTLETFDVDCIPSVLSPATPLVSPEKNTKDTNQPVFARQMKGNVIANPLPVPPQVEGIAFDVVNKLFTNPNISTNGDKKKTFVHLIDSGGQPSFIGLVPAFVRGSMVNIVASKFNHAINDKLQYEYVKDDRHLRKPSKLEKSQLEGMEELIRTLSSVKHSEEGSGRGSSEPKFLLIGTHADKHWSLFDETLSGKNRWLKKSLGKLKSTCIKVNRDGDLLLPINTRVTKGRCEVASSIRQKIMDACSDAEVDIPTRWYIFELEVSGKARKESRGVLGLAECIEVGGKLSMGEEDVIAALVFLDGAAVCLYFQAATPHLVFTDPQAILSEVTEILNIGIIDKKFIPSHYPDVDKLRDQGLFNKNLLDIVCSKYRVNEKGKCSYSVDDFLSILQHLLIIAPVCINGEELFFIPSILPTCKKISSFSCDLAPLVLLCRTRVIPLGLFSALVVALLGDKLFFLDEILGCNAISLECKVGGGVVLLIECHAWLTVHFNGNKLAAPCIRDAIHHAIATVCRQRHLDTNQIVFTDGFFCPFKICESIPHACVANTAFSPAHLTCSVRPKVGCGPCSDDGMLAWLAAPDASTVSASSFSATPQSPPPTVLATIGVASEEKLLFNTKMSDASTVKELPTAAAGVNSADPSRTLTENDLCDVLAVIRDLNDWKDLGLQLGLFYPTLTDIEMYRRGKPSECRIDMLSAWLQQQDNVSQKGVPSLNVLKTALQSMGEHETANRIS